jgi:hypothetical protein
MKSVAAQEKATQPMVQPFVPTRPRGKAPAGVKFNSTFHTLLEPNHQARYDRSAVKKGTPFNPIYRTLQQQNGYIK